MKISNILFILLTTYAANPRGENGNKVSSRQARKSEREQNDNSDDKGLKKSKKSKDDDSDDMTVNKKSKAKNSANGLSMGLSIVLIMATLFLCS